MLPTEQAAHFESLGGQAYLISVRPPNARQRWIARAVVLALVAAFAIMLPFRSVPLPRRDAFIPIADSLIFLNELLTAWLLYSQFVATRNRALLGLASGYLFSGLLCVSHLLSFPGAFAPTGLLGANVLSTTPWLRILHLYGFLAGALAYAVDDGPRAAIPADDRRVASAIATSVAVVVIASVVATWLTTVHGAWLPAIMRDAVRTSAAFDPTRAWLLLAPIPLAVVVIWRRHASILDLWLGVALATWVLDMVASGIVSARFSVMFYVAWTMSFLSSGFVLLALLTESMSLRTRLVQAVAARDQERVGNRTALDVMLGSIAHELRQPLASIVVNGEAGARMLSAATVHRDAVRETFDDIRASATRASEIIDSVRALFAPAARAEQSFDLNELVRQAARTTQLDRDTHGVVLQLDLASDLPSIRGNRGQLMQVLVNGVTNAVDSLATVTDRPRQLVIRTARFADVREVSVLIEDTGAGIGPDVADRVFEPFVTTKPAGMGLGLAICRSIVQAHGGTLALTARPECGAVLRIDLPVDAASDATVPNARRPAPSAFDGTGLLR